MSRAIRRHCPYVKLAKKQSALDEFALPVEFADFDHEAAGACGRVRAALQKKATPIGSMHPMIGVDAFALRGTLASKNTREFPASKA